MLTQKQFKKAIKNAILYGTEEAMNADLDGSQALWNVILDALTFYKAHPEAYSAMVAKYNLKENSETRLDFMDLIKW